MKRLSFFQWANSELILYKDKHFATKQDQHFVLKVIQFLVSIWRDFSTLIEVIQYISPEKAFKSV